MKIVKIMGLALLAGFTLGMVGCGKAASTGNTGSVNTGNTNTGGDEDGGVVIVGDGEAQPPGTTGVRDQAGKCYNDTDKDNICNEQDTDIDGDGTNNTEDNDIDGDGDVNTIDDDIDGDGVDNIDDADMDGDGIANDEDTDIDGDGTPDATDSDVDGDGIVNGEDNDIDGDGVENPVDPDMDGDGTDNNTDTDTDGDGQTNTEDPDANGDGEVENPDAGTGTTGEGVSVSFTDDGLVNLLTNSIAKSGTGTHYMDFSDIKDSAAAKDADISTITLTSIDVSVDAASAALLTASAGTKVKLNISYQVAGGAKVLVGTTSNAYPITIADLLAGISMSDGKIQKDANNFPLLQGLIAQQSVAGASIILDVAVIDGTLPDASINLEYVVKASAKVKI